MAVLMYGQYSRAGYSGARTVIEINPEIFNLSGLTRKLFSQQVRTIFKEKYQFSSSFSDRDKPNTANSEVTYSIIGGNEQRKFSVEATSSKKAVIVLRKDLDYDSGDKLFNLTIRAEVRKIINIVKFGGQFGTIWDNLG